jgi:hypothetical protein
VVLLVITFFKRDVLKITLVNAKYQRQGYFICSTFDCPSKKLTNCEKSFFRIDFGDRYIEEFVYEENNQCIFKIVKSDKSGMECSFDKTVLKTLNLPTIIISNYELFPETKEACQMVQY